MEFVWRPMWDTLGDSAQIFTSTLFNGYDSPHVIDWDMLGDSDPFISDESLKTYNADQKSLGLYKHIME